VGDYVTADGMTLMFLWTPGRGFETIGDMTLFPFALSNNDWIAGEIFLQQSAFVWHRDLGVVDIGFLPGGSFSNAYDVNNRGEVVGDATTATGMHAFLWTRTEGLVDLNDRLVNPPPAELQSARDINDAGVILASTSAGLVLLFPYHGGHVTDDYLSRQVSSQ
jgi:probable HAF family extracellular repeat protein